MGSGAAAAWAVRSILGRWRGCTMSSMPARTLATADKMELRMVTQGSTIGASSSSFSPQPFSSPVKRLPPCDRGVPAGSTSKWRASSAAGGRPPWTTVTPSLRLRFRHLTTSDITRLAAHAAVSSRCLGRLEQRATLPHERQHGRRGQQLPLRLRRGHLLRLTRRCSRRCTRSTSVSTSRCPTVSPHSLRWSWSCGTGSAALALRKHPSHRTPLIPTLRPPHLPHPAHHTRRVQPAALLRLTLHVSVRCRLHPRRKASSRTPTRGSSFARCPSYQAQVTPSRPVVLPHTRLGSGSHMH